MTDILDGVRDQYRATGLDQFHTRGLAATAQLAELVGVTADLTEAARAWFAQVRASDPPPALNLGVVLGPDFARAPANLGRNLMQGRLAILTAVFEAAPIQTL